MSHQCPSHLAGHVLGRQQVFQLHLGLGERQVDGEPAEDDSAQQGETFDSLLSEFWVGRTDPDALP